MHYQIVNAIGVGCHASREKMCRKGTWEKNYEKTIGRSGGIVTVSTMAMAERYVMITHKGQTHSGQLWKKVVVTRQLPLVQSSNTTLTHRRRHVRHGEVDGGGVNPDGIIVSTRCGRIGRRDPRSGTQVSLLSQ